jgi:hypothetical protein
MMLLSLPVLVLVLIILLNFLYKRTNHWKNQFIDVCFFAKKNKQNQKFRIINLGSNHPKFAIDYMDNFEGRNFAVGPQTFEYDFAILRHCKDLLYPNAIVIIPVCLLSFFFFRQPNRSAHVKYFAFLSRKEIVGCKRFEKMKNYYFPLVSHPKYVRFLFKDVKCDMRMNYEKNPLDTDEKLKQDASKWIRNWEKQFSISLPDPNLDSANIESIDANIEILKNMFGYCKKNGLRPVLVILPVTRYLSSLLTNDFVEKFVLGNIRKANTMNVPVLNYLDDPRFVNPELYINSFFMNRRGRKIFSPILFNDIERYLDKI